MLLLSLTILFSGCNTYDKRMWGNPSQREQDESAAKMAKQWQNVADSRKILHKLYPNEYPSEYIQFHRTIDPELYSPIHQGPNAVPYRGNGTVITPY